MRKILLLLAMLMFVSVATADTTYPIDSVINSYENQIRQLQDKVKYQSELIQEWDTKKQEEFAELKANQKKPLDKWDIFNLVVCRAVWVIGTMCVISGRLKESYEFWIPMLGSILWYWFFGE